MASISFAYSKGSRAFNFVIRFQTGTMLLCQILSDFARILGPVFIQIEGNSFVASGSNLESDHFQISKGGK